MSPEEKLAEALLSIEPEKIQGGSKARQDWLSLIMSVISYLHENGGDTYAFQRKLLGSSFPAFLIPAEKK